MKWRDILKAYWDICYELWRWRGQVDLEEHMDNNFFDAFLWVLYDKKTAMPLHKVSCDWEERAVKYKLRSDHWREWVKKTTKEKMDKTLDILNNLLWDD
jgi:hypothetical protein